MKQTMHHLRILAALAAAPVLSAIAAPANDEWTNAQAVPFAGAALSVNVTLANASAADPHCGGGDYQSVWYAYTSPVNQFIQARASASTPVDQRPRLSAWTHGPGGFAAADCHPDAHEVGFQAAAGTTYYLQLAAPVPGVLTLLNLNVNPNAFVNSYEPPAPANNLFWYATPVPGLPQTIAADVGAGRGDAYDPGVCGDPARAYILGDSLWYSYTAPASGSVDVLFDSPYDAPYVGVFTGNLDRPNFIACDQQGDARDGATRFQAQAGVTYFIEFASGSELLGSKPASLAFRPTPPATGGSIVAPPTVGRYKRVVFVPEVGYKVETHLLVTLDLRCDTPLVAVLASATVTQATKSISKQQSISCSGGSGRVTLDLSDAKGFSPGPAQVAVRGFDFDANYVVEAAGTTLIVKGRP
jgi:hypothetical protein